MALQKFEGRQVAASRISIVGAGDGLSDALDIEPIALKHGQEVQVVLRCVVRDVDHVPLKKGESSILARKHVLATMDATLLLGDTEGAVVVKELLADNADRIQRAKDSMAGQGRLDDDPEDD